MDLENVKTDFYGVDEIPKSLKPIYDRFRLANFKPQPQQQPAFLSASEAADDATGDQQRAVLVALAKTQFDVANPSHQHILNSVRNKLALSLPHHTLSCLKVQIELRELLKSMGPGGAGGNYGGKTESAVSQLKFEKDITEAVGFSNGEKPWEDVVNATAETDCGMLGFICALNFCEKIDKIYDDAYQDFEGEEEGNLCLKNLLYISQNSPLKSRLDGFPLILVIFEIVASCAHLVEDKPYVAKNPLQKKELQYWKHHQKVFKLIGQKFFNNNMYDTFNEYVYHMVLTFCLAWRGSIAQARSQLQWNLAQNELRAQQAQNDQEKGTASKRESEFYLYKRLFARKMEEGQDNHHQIEDYREVMDDVEDFVFTQIHELVCLRQSQTDFRNVASKMAKYKQ